MKLILEGIRRVVFRQDDAHARSLNRGIPERRFENVLIVLSAGKINGDPAESPLQPDLNTALAALYRANRWLKMY